MQHTGYLSIDLDNMMIIGYQITHCEFCSRLHIGYSSPPLIETPLPPNNLSSLEVSFGEGED